METKHSIKCALKAIIEAFEPEIGNNEELTPGQNTALTDALAEELGRLNPTHDYPPVNK